MKHYPGDPHQWADMPVVLTDTELLIGGWQVMQSWEQPMMDLMAQQVANPEADVLEVGFGMGISATALIEYGCRSYTVIEAHPEVATIAREWAKQYDTPITVLEGMWQEVVPDLHQQFDGIFFDTYPLSAEERHCNHFPFIPVAPKLLRPNGKLTCYSDETIEFRNEHLKLLLSNFEEVKLIKVSNLHPFEGCEYWDYSHMVVPVATKLANPIGYSTNGSHSD
ncbi:MAG: class I SAM-dependent methyltransferase [Chloroflexota bacterium]